MFGKVFGKLFGKKEYRILMLGKVTYLMKLIRLE